MKGIILAGGTGSRLWPITQGVSKQLVPVYDKPMIYYPLTTLMLAGVRDILVITTAADAGQFKGLLGDGSQFGVPDVCCARSPRRVGRGVHRGEDFIGSDPVALVLGIIFSMALVWERSFGGSISRTAARSLPIGWRSHRPMVWWISMKPVRR